MVENLYDILGVKKADKDDVIRKAYRKLARKHHPDVNPGDKKAEETFKKIAGAYDVLSDPKKRAAYDEFGEDSLKGGFEPNQAREYARWKDTRQQRTSQFEQGPIEFDFADFFGQAGFGQRGGRPPGPARGRDLQAVVEMDLRQAIEGGEVGFEMQGQPPMKVRIPPGADSGSTIRLKGKGSPGPRGGPPGDLIIQTVVKPHPFVRRDGRDRHFKLPVSIGEAYRGASIEIPTFDGPVNLKIPALSQNGAKLRLRGKGVKRKDQRGDLFVELDVRTPDRHDEALAAALQASDGAYSTPVRKELTL